jgi:hypothetical protein
MLLRPTTQEEIRDDSAGLECMDEVSVTLSIFDAETISRARQTVLEICQSSPATLSQISKALCEESFFEEAICVALMVSNAWVHRKLLEGCLKPTRTYEKYVCASCSGDDYLITLEETGP